MALSAILGGLSVAASIFGSKKQSKANKNAAKANAEIAKLNASISRENAYDVELAGRFAEMELYAHTNRAVGKTRAAVAGAGIVVDDAGTVSQELVADMIHMGAMDIERIRRNVALEQKKHERQAESFDLQAKYGVQAANAINPNFDALVSGVGAFTAAYQGGLFDGIMGG